MSGSVNSEIPDVTSLQNLLWLATAVVEHRGSAFGHKMLILTEQY